MCNVLCYDRVADVYKDGDCYLVVLHVIILLRMFHFEIIYIYICMYLFSTNPLFRNYYYRRRHKCIRHRHHDTCRDPRDDTRYIMQNARYRVYRRIAHLLRKLKYECFYLVLIGDIILSIVQ